METSGAAITISDDEGGVDRLDSSLPNRVHAVTTENFKPGDYVLATKFSDADPHDPWRVGLILSIEVFKEGCKVHFKEGYGSRYYYAVKLSKEQGDYILFKHGQNRLESENKAIADYFVLFF